GNPVKYSLSIERGVVTPACLHSPRVQGRLDTIAQRAVRGDQRHDAWNVLTRVDEVKARVDVVEDLEIPSSQSLAAVDDVGKFRQLAPRDRRMIFAQLGVRADGRQVKPVEPEVGQQPRPSGEFGVTEADQAALG